MASPGLFKAFTPLCHGWGVGAILPDEALGEHLRDIAGVPQEEAEAV